MDITALIGRLFADLLPVFGAAFISLAAFAAHKLAAKLNLDSIAGSQALLDDGIAKGVAYAESWAKTQTLKPVGNAKMEVALTLIETIVGNPLFVQFGEPQIKKLVEAFLQNQIPQPAAITAPAQK